VDEVVSNTPQVFDHAKADKCSNEEYRHEQKRLIAGQFFVHATPCPVHVK